MVRATLIMLLSVVALAAPSDALAAWQPIGGQVNDTTFDEGLNPRLATVGGALHVAYTAEDRANGGERAYSQRFQSGTWQSPTDLSDRSFSRTNDLHEIGGQLYAAWSERQTTEDDWGLFVGRFVDGGWEKVGTGPLTSAGRDADVARLTSLDGTPCVVYVERDDEPSQVDAFVKCFEAGVWTLKGGGRVEPAGVFVDSVELAAIAGKLHVAWGENAAQGERPRVSRLDGNTWTPLGTGTEPITGSEDALTRSFSLVDVGGIPYLAFTESVDWEGTPFRLRVLRFENGTWSPVGDQAQLSDPDLQADDVSLAVIGGSPHVAYTEGAPDFGNAELLYVKRLVGGSWVKVGGVEGLNRGTGTQVFAPHLIDVQGLPYITWSETNGTDNRAIFASRDINPVANLVRPKVTGGTTVGSLLRCDSGTWAGTPSSYMFSWETAPAGSDAWEPIPGAVSNEFVVRSLDGGRRVRCRVVASDGLNTGDAASDAVDIAPVFLGSVIADEPMTLPPPRDSAVVFIPPKPSAIFGTSSKVKGAAWLNGATSQAFQGAKIVQFAWDINTDKKPEATCAGNAPAASIPFRKPGIFDVGLTVRDSRGLLATASFKTTVSVSQTTVRPIAVSTCEAPAAASALAPTPADCIKNFAWGMVDVQANGASNQCFQTEEGSWFDGGRSARAASVKARAAQLTEAERRRALVEIVPLKASIRGPIKLNGLPIPVPSAVTTKYNIATNQISIGKYPIQLQIPEVSKPINLTELALTKTVKADENGRFKLGSAKAQLPGIKALGGLKMGGGAEFTLLASRRSEVKLALQLPNIFTLGYGSALEGSVTVRGDNTDGFEFEGARLKVPFASFGPIGLEKVFFDYQRTGNQMTGGANVSLLPNYGPKILASPEDGYGFKLRNGAFFEGGLGASFDPGIPVFPGISMTEVGAAFGVDPLRLTGRLAVAGGEVVEIDGTAFVALATKETPYDYPDEFIQPGMEFLGGRKLDSFSAAIGGDVNLKLPVLGKIKMSEGYVFYAYPGLIEAGGKIKIEKDLKVGKFSIEGGIKGFVEFESGKFNMKGEVKGCLTVETWGPFPNIDLCPKVGAVVSSKGAGFCVLTTLPVPFPPVPIIIGAGMKWSDSAPSVSVYSCNYEDYEVKNPRARAAQATRSVSLPSGLPAAQIRVTGQGGVPAVTVTRPNGQKAEPGASDVIAFAENKPGSNATIVAIKKPAGGGWTIGTEPGSPAITKVEVAEALPEPKVRATLGGAGARRTLSYSLTDAPGQTVTFYEKGRRTWKELGVAKGAQGSLTFTPGDGAKETRRIVAVVERGAKTYELTVARYAAAGTQRPARPARLRVKRKGARVTATWRKVKGAERYQVTLRPRTGIPLTRVVRARSVAFPIERRVRGTLSVVAQRLDARPSRAARARVPAR